MRYLLLLCIAIKASAIVCLPQQFNITERFLSLMPTFDMSTETESFAVASKRFFSLKTTFDLEDVLHRPIATAESRFFAWGTVVDITDPVGNRVGWIEEEVFRILPWAEYRIFNADNQIVAIAKMNFWGTYFNVFHPDDENEIYATISRPFFRFIRDCWTVEIKNLAAFEKGYIDSRLMIFLAIYQTDKENRDRMRNEFMDQLVRERDYYEGRRL